MPNGGPDRGPESATSPYPGTMKSQASYSLRAENVAERLGALAAALLFLHVLTVQILFNESLGLVDRLRIEYWQLSVFDLDQEAGFGTWFSAGMLLFAGLLLLHQAKTLRTQGSREDLWWHILGTGFCVLSMDEVVGIHEWLNTLLEKTDWTVYGFAIFVILSVAYLPFLWRHRGRLALLFVLAAAVYGGGAVGVEHFTDGRVDTLHYNMWTTLEEGMEMSGVIIFIYAILDHLRGDPDQVIRIEVGLEDQAGEQSEDRLGNRIEG